MESHTKPHNGVQHPYLTMMSLYLGAFVGMFGETALNITLPELTNAFHVETALMQWMVVGHMLVIGLVLPFASLLLKWFSVRKLTFFSLGAFIVGSLMSGFATNFPMLLLGRMVQGFGPGLILPMMFALVLEVFPKERIGSAMGLCALIVMFAPAIGPTLAGFIVGALSWRWIFFLFAAILGIALLFAARFMISPYEITKPHIDLPSCVTSAIGFGGLVIGVGLTSLYGWTSLPVIVSLLIGVVSIVIYGRRQLSMERPVLDLRAFKIAGFRTGTILVMLVFGITMSSMYLMPQYIQRGIMLPIAMAGVVLLPGGLMNAICSLISGKLYDKIGAKVPVLAGFALAAVGAFLLLFTSSGTSVWYVILCHVILLIGVPLAMSPSQTNGLAALPPELSTDGSTILNTMQQVWGAICTAVATSLLGIGQNAYQGTDPAKAFTNGFHYGLGFTLLLAVIGFAVALTLKAKDKTKATVPSGSLAKIMKHDVYSLSEHDLVKDALQLFTSKGISGAPILDKNNKLVGFISDGDILKHIADQVPTFRSAWSFIAEQNNQEFNETVEYVLNLPVLSIARKDVITVDIGEELGAVCKTLAEKELKKAPVVSNSEMVGIINRSNITRYAVESYFQK